MTLVKTLLAHLHNMELRVSQVVQLELLVKPDVFEGNIMKLADAANKSC